MFSPQSVTWLGSIVHGSVFVSNFQLLADVGVRLFGVEQRRTASLLGSLSSMGGRAAGQGQGAR